jgi:hypothetical protein
MKNISCFLAFSSCAFPLALGLLLLASCGSPNTPLDAETRQFIDSAATEQIRVAQHHIDSNCTYIRYHGMQHLVDSIKQVRLREIEEQLKTVPR